MRSTPLNDLGLTLPILAAPMAGGPTTPELVIAAARTGGMGFLAGGYKTAQVLGEQIDAVRTQTPTFGVNLFAPNLMPVDRYRYRDYLDAIRPDADRYGVTLPINPVEDDDNWRDKIDLLLANPAPVVSFTFGIPSRAALEALHATGSVLVQTVTSPEEALQAADAGVDMLAVQASAAGGHSGTLYSERVPEDKPLEQLLAEVRHAVALPLMAAGGLADPAQVATAVHGYADAVVVGTILLRSAESGASTAHRTALTDPNRGDTVVTRAFTGRPARALRNTFINQYDAIAPTGYPALHHLTSPLRRAATAGEDPEFVNLWAGTGYRQATDEPAEDILRRLSNDL